MVRPGGSVLAFDFDSDQTVIGAPDPVLARRIAEVLDAAVPHPQVIFVTGARGFALYQQLTQGTIARALRAGQISAAEVGAWWAILEQAAWAQAFFSANLGFIVVGRKP